jgi:rare lipoprotein A
MKKLIGLLTFFLFSFTVLRQDSFTGIASYYHDKMHGKRTASGERYHKDSLVCAHASFAFGTRLKVTNLKNDSTRVIKVIDRMSKHSKHIIDVSSGAAKQLGFYRDGVAHVQIQVLK